MSDFGGAGGVVADFGDLLEAGAQASQEFAVEGTAGRGEGVIDPLAVFAGDDEADAAQVGQMARGGGLGNVKHPQEVIDAPLALAEQMENAQAGAVREGPEDRIGVELARRPLGRRRNRLDGRGHAG